MLKRVSLAIEPWAEASMATDWCYQVNLPVLALVIRTRTASLR